MFTGILIGVLPVTNSLVAVLTLLTCVDVPALLTACPGTRTALLVEVPYNRGLAVGVVMTSGVIKLLTFFLEAGLLLNSYTLELL
jgi:hypothetical protein